MLVAARRDHYTMTHHSVGAIHAHTVARPAAFPLLMSAFGFFGWQRKRMAARPL